MPVILCKTGNELSCKCIVTIKSYTLSARLALSLQLGVRGTYFVGIVRISRSFPFLFFSRRSQCTRDSIVTRLQAGRPGFDSRQGQGFLFTTTSDRLVCPYSTLSNGHKDLFPGSKEAGA
jgi:hypothetical protein